MLKAEDQDSEVPLAMAVNLPLLTLEFLQLISAASGNPSTSFDDIAPQGREQVNPCLGGL